VPNLQTFRVAKIKGLNSNKWSVLMPPLSQKIYGCSNRIFESVAF
jgi:hypothetical protein